MKTKFGVFDKLKVFKALVENQTRKKIKTIKYDGGDKYYINNFNTFYKENGIVKQTTTPYTIEQNGVVEKKNRTLIESVQ